MTIPKRQNIVACTHWDTYGHAARQPLDLICQPVGRRPAANESPSSQCVCGPSARENLCLLLLLLPTVPILVAHLANGRAVAVATVPGQTLIPGPRQVRQVEARAEAAAKGAKDASSSSTSSERDSNSLG